MGAIEVNASSSICRKCGTAYSRLKGYFPVSYSQLYKGTGYLPYCRECVDKIYRDYLNDCGDIKMAVRQTCRKLDLYWNEKLFTSIEKQNSTRSLMTNYIAKTNSLKMSGKSYDDTLVEEGSLWTFSNDGAVEEVVSSNDKIDNEHDEIKKEIPESVIIFWGKGYDYDFYNELQGRYDAWTKGRVGLEQNEISLYKQICLLEATIARDGALGRPIDKNMNTLNTLLGSMSLKPIQKKDDSDMQTDNTPFGVWIKKWENQRPIPDVDPELKDVDGIVRYISIWFLGHLCKMLGIKNTYCKLYEEEIEKMRIERPEYDEEDDETMFNDIFSHNAEEDG